MHMHCFPKLSIGRARFLRLGFGLLAGTLAAWAGTTATSVVLSNEGGLIDKLIAAGHGNDTLYQVMQYLQPYSNGAISTAFMAQLASCPEGSEIFTARLAPFSPDSANPVGVNSDGSLIVVDFRGRDYYGQTGYTTTSSVAGPAGKVMFTSAGGPSYYIDTGATVSGGGSTYKAVTVIWAESATSATPLPPSAWLVLTGLGGAGAFGLRRRRFQTRG
jgi:hypothetical protein